MEVEEVDLNLFVKQAIPDDPEKVRLSLIFSKDLISTLQQDIADLHHRLHIADTEFEESNNQYVDEEEDDRVHEDNPTLTKIDDFYGDTQTQPHKGVTINTEQNTNNTYNLYDDQDDQEDLETAKTQALNKKKNNHDRFFSTYNLLSKQVNTGDQLISSMGTYEQLMQNAMNAITFNDVIANLKAKLRNTKDSFSTVQEALNEIVDESKDAQDNDNDDGLNQLLSLNAQQVTDGGKSIIQCIEEVIDELNGAHHLIHSDHKKIFELQSRVKELQVSLPLHKIKKLAVLAELPAFIKQELSDIKIQQRTEERRKALEQSRQKHKKKRTLVDDNITNIDFKQMESDEANLDDNTDDNDTSETNSTEERIESFHSTLEGVKTCVETINSRINYIDGDILDIMGISYDDEDDESNAFQKNMVESIRAELKIVVKSSKALLNHFRNAKEYAHPSQKMLIRAVLNCVDIKVENDSLKKEITRLESEIEAQNEKVKMLQKEQLPDLEDLEETNKGKGVHFQSQNEADNSDTSNSNDTFVVKIAKQLAQLKEKSYFIRTSLKMDTDALDTATAEMKSALHSNEIQELDTEIEVLQDMVTDLGEMLSNDQNSFLNLTPTKEYILRLEDRYDSMKQLYRLKFSEIEKSKDLIIFNENELEVKMEEITELEERLTRIMTSASTSAETRMEALNTMNKKSQTYNSIIDLIDDTLRRTSSALLEIERLIQIDSNLRNRDYNNSNNNDILNYCDTIKKGLLGVQEEVIGIRSFVHPDREMVQSLQEEILQMKQQQEFPTQSASPTMTTSYARRQKSVHEIAWSKFNAGQESNMEDLQKKETQVLEEELRKKILNEIQEDYDDKMDEAISKMKNDVRQEVRREFEDNYTEMPFYKDDDDADVNELVADADDYNGDGDDDDDDDDNGQNTNRSTFLGIDIDKLRREYEDEYDKRLENEKANIEKYYNDNMANMTNELDEYKNNCNVLENEMEQIRSENEKQMKYLEKSKFDLIESTSNEIENLRQKIKMYSLRNWNGVISK